MCTYYRISFHLHFEVWRQYFLPFVSLWGMHPYKTKPDNNWNSNSYKFLEKETNINEHIPNDFWKSFLTGISAQYHCICTYTKRHQSTRDMATLLGILFQDFGLVSAGGGSTWSKSMLLETHVAYLNCLSRALKCVLSSRNKWLTWELQEGKTNTCIQSCHISANPRLGQDFCSLARNIETWWRHQHKKNQDCKTGKVWLNSTRNVIATPNGVPFAHKSKETEITHTM